MTKKEWVQLTMANTTQTVNISDEMTFLAERLRRVRKMADELDALGMFDN